MTLMRFFNTAGPVVPEDHYCVPPLERMDLDGVLSLVQQKKYFVLHAPRQTGKTTALLALRDRLNEGAAGPLSCVYANIEAGQALRENLDLAMRAILARIAAGARRLGDDSLGEISKQAFADAGPGGVVTETLSRWCESSPRPLVLLLDEVDALVGDTLVSFLRQLRAGYDQRPRAFPQSVALCGLRDVRDYRMHLEPGKQVITGGSPFNIRAESLRLGDFTEAETHALLTQHTGETGQHFEPAALEAVWEQTLGQPWLVNALAYEACFDNRLGRDRSRAITADAILDAREALILRRETHLDQLADKLLEDRVRRVIEPSLIGAAGRATIRDIEYVRDLGLIARDAPVRVANPIYREVVPRELTRIVQEELDLDASSFIAADGGLRHARLIEDFQEYFREHSEHWIGRFDYSEAGAQLLLHAFLHRVVNGGGRVEREYALGRGRADLLLRWPRGDHWEQFVVECKMRHGSREATERRGLEQTAAYMARCGAKAGHLVIFDRDGKRSWKEKIYRREAEVAGAPITIWGM